METESNSQEDIIPQRFIDGCEGNLEEARKRWETTKAWRESEGVNEILAQPQPYFHLIKKHYPHYHAGRGKLGHHVFYERTGEFDYQTLFSKGITIDDLVKHWLFLTEYQWRIMCNDEEDAKSITVFDATNIKMTDFAGSNMDYVKRTIGYANHHYPERSFKIFIINAPFYMSFLWRLLKPLVHENTQKKVHILSGSDNLSVLQEYIDIEQIPTYYGGKLDFGGNDSCRFQSPETLEISNYVNQLNSSKDQGKEESLTFTESESESTIN